MATRVGDLHLTSKQSESAFIFEIVKLTLDSWWWQRVGPGISDDHPTGPVQLPVNKIYHKIYTEQGK